MLILLTAIRTSSVAEYKNMRLPRQDRTKATQWCVSYYQLFYKLTHLNLQSVTTFTTFTTLPTMKLPSTALLLSSSSAIGPNATLNIGNKAISPDGFQRS